MNINIETLRKLFPINRVAMLNTKAISFIILLPTLLLASEGFKGFGLQVGTQGTGVFFHQTWRSSDKLQWLFHGKIFDIKGDEQMMVYDYYTGQYHSVGDKYVFIVPLFGGGKYFPFADQIANNFAPFVTIQLGPVLTIDGAESNEFSTRWGKSKGLWSVGCYTGVGVDFLMVNGMMVSVGVGMDILPMNGIVDDEDNYNGAIIHVGFNWRR